MIWSQSGPTIWVPSKESLWPTATTTWTLPPRVRCRPVSRTTTATTTASTTNQPQQKSSHWCTTTTWPTAATEATGATEATTIVTATASTIDSCLDKQMTFARAEAKDESQSRRYNIWNPNLGVNSDNWSGGCLVLVRTKLIQKGQHTHNHTHKAKHIIHKI